MAEIDEIVAMMKEGKSDAEIIRELTKRGIAPTQISSLITAARAKSAVKEELTPSITERGEVPAPKKEEEIVYPEAAAPAEIETEAIEEIAEEIIAEKWEEVRERIARMSEWKEFTEARMKSIEERLKRIEYAIDNLHSALAEKIKEYGKGMQDVGKEIKMLETTMSSIMKPLTENIKQLEKITKKEEKKEK